MAYRTWVNSTTPAINANNLNTIQEALGYVSVKDRSLSGGGAVGDGTTDDRAAIQAAINALPTRGGVIYFPAGTYKINASAGIGLDLSGKDSVTLIGERGTEFNHGGTQGTVITCGSSSMTLIKCDGGASVKQGGPRFIGLNFYSSQASCKLARIEMTNHWGFEDCAFEGSGSGLIGLELDIPSTDHPAGDNNWNFLERCRFSFAAGVGTGAIAVNILEAGVFITNTVFNLETGMTGVRIIKGQNSVILGSYFTGSTSTAGNAVYCEGGGTALIGCMFENFSPSGSSPSVEFQDGAEPYQGKNNKIVGCYFISGELAIEVGTGCNNTVCVANTFNTTANIIDNGSSTTIVEPDQVKLAPWSGSKIGFFGAVPAVKPTITGSRGANAALASLLTALNTMGLITDQSSG